MKPFQILLIISFLLTACAPRTTAATPPAQATVASTPSPTETSPVENTKIVPTPTEKAKTIEELAADILAGETVDISALTLEQQAQLAQELSSHAKEMAQLYLNGEIDSSVIDSLPLALRQEFSAAYAELKNEAMGINFISFTYIKDEQYYLDPQTLAMEKLPTDLDEEFMREHSFDEVYLPVDFDETGNVIYFYKGEWRTVSNSAGFDFSMDITDPYDTRIEFPKQAPIAEGEYAGLTPLQSLLVDKDDSFTIIPVIPLKDALGEIAFKAGKAFSRESVFQILTFETDRQGKPILAKVSLVIPSGAFLLSEEGGGEIITSTSRIKDYGTFWGTLEENKIYYLSVADDPRATIDYSSHISDENIEGISLGHSESDDVPVVVGSTFIKRKID